MPPCSYCNKHNKVYVVTSDSKKYSEYICTKCKYNVERPSTSNWSAIDTIEERLEQETEETAQIIATAAAKLACL